MIRQLHPALDMPYLDSQKRFYDSMTDFTDDFTHAAHEVFELCDLDDEASMALAELWAIAQDDADASESIRHNDWAEYKDLIAEAFED
jgi:hypothetical protein